MREASIILPHAGNRQSHDLLHGLLLQHFGGYTAQAVIGAWRDPATAIVHNDQSTMFLIGADPTAANLALLHFIAKECGNMAGQICVYVKGFDGEVTFVQC